MKSFTIIIPSFNSEKYISSCLDSLVNLEYDHDLIEVLVIDDGSTDKTKDIVKEYTWKYSFIKYFKKENNHWGSVINYVKNNKLATFDYISILDSDDQLTTKSLIILNDLSEKENSDLLVGSFRKWDGVKLRKKIYPYFFLFKRTLHNKKQMNTPFCLPLIFFSKNEVFYKLNDLSEKMAYQDPDYLSQLVKNSNSLTFSNKTIGLYYFNREGNSISEPWNKIRLMGEYNACLKSIENGAQEVVAFRLCQKNFRRILDSENSDKFNVNRKFSFQWFPAYMRFFFTIIFWFKLRKYFTFNLK
ncbi:MAG: glycosyltransferase family 2 protein [Mycoplasmataceae bacterium]|nr:glycosyltransferase family 2 protein [Mycoplasmataceae bacterium]